MGKRYYCDYCERSFQDNTHNRKKHLNGVQHHRAKKAWYAHFRDSAAILSEEQTKTPCRRFQQTGSCSFGPSCRFSHMSERDMEHLQRQLDDEQHTSEEPDAGSSAQQLLQDWLSRREKRSSASGPGIAGSDQESQQVDLTDWSVPPLLLSIPDLPPSLLPPPSKEWSLQCNTEWG